MKKIMQSSGINNSAVVFLFTAMFLLSGYPKAQIITTIAGNGTPGYNSDGIQATASELNRPSDAAVDKNGNIYIADNVNNRIRRVDAVTGIITTVAGNGISGYNGDGIQATAAEINRPWGIALDTAGNIFIADWANARIRKVTLATGLISTVAGNGVIGFNGDGIQATAAELNYPNGVAVQHGIIYISDCDNYRVRKVSLTGIISTTAGTGSPGYNGDGIQATAAEIQNVSQMALDVSGNLFLTDYYNNRIRKVNSSTGIISTVAGNGTPGYNGDGIQATAAELYFPTGVYFDVSQNMYISDYNNNRIREVNHLTGIISTVAGNGVDGYSGDNGPATAAEIALPWGGAVTNTAFYFAEFDASFGNRVRKVTIASPIVLITSSTGVKCSGGSTGAAGVTASGGTPPYTYSWAPAGGTNAMATGLSAGNYTVTVKDTNGFIATAAVAVTQPPILTVTASSTPSSCAGNTGTASASAVGGTGAFTYNWSPGGQNNANITGLSIGTYTVTVTDANGCTATATTTVNGDGLTVTIIGIVNVTCNGGNNGSATASATGGSLPYTYNWAPAGGTSAIANGLTAASYTLTVRDANGCSATASATLTQPPPLSVSPPFPGVCPGDTVVLTASGAASYSWSPPAGLNTTVGPIVKAYPAVTTTYTVTGTTGGCVSSLAVTVTVSPPPVITLVPPSANLCSGDSVVIRAYGALSYTWAPAGGLSNNVGLVVTAFPMTTTTYTVTGNNNGCSSTQTITITVSPTPTVTVNPAVPSPTCSGDSVSLTASGATSYSWTPSTGLSSITDASVRAAPAITTSYTVTGTTGSCSNYAVVVVTVNPTPTVSVTPSAATICSGGAGVNLTAGGATTYTWAPPAGLSGITGSSVTASPSVTTIYTVTGTTGSCSATQTVTITVNATPTVVVTPSPASICKGDSVSLTASGAGTYTWSPASGLSAITGATVKASPATTTSYTVTGTNASCTGTAVVMVSVNPKPVVTLLPPSATICAGGAGVTLSASGAATYAWSPPGGLSSPTGHVVTADPGTTTTYTVTGTTEGCSDSAEVTITVDSAVVAAISGKDTICAGDSTVLTASGGGAYSWSTGATSSSVTLKPAVSTQYTVTVTKGACSNTAVKLVVVKDCTVGINALTFADNIDIFPNPTSGNVQVVCNIPAGDYIFNLTDVLGQVLLSEKRHVTGSYSYLMNMSGYSSGMYILTIEGVNSITQKKIVLNK